MLKRGAFRVLLAVALAGAGALFGAGLHWWVVQPTDAELIATAREADLPGFAGADRPRVTGAWAPSFTRGIVHWDAVATGTLGESAALASKALEDQGWTVVDEAMGERSGDVVATRPGAVLTVHLRAVPGEETEASVSLHRGSTTPSLSMIVIGGAVVGCTAGAGLASALVHRRRAAWGSTGGGP